MKFINIKLQTGNLTCGILLKAVFSKVAGFLQALIDRGVLNCLRFCEKRPSKKQYKRLNDLLCNSPSWPPLNQSLLPTCHTLVHFS